MDSLFILLRLGLNTSTVGAENLTYIKNLSADEWQYMGNIAREQGALGILLDGIDRLENSSKELTKNLITNYKLEWIGEVLQIEQKNRQQTKTMFDMAERWRMAGCRVMLMKGQANGLLYPSPHRRSPGDIDCYLFGEYSLGNKIAQQVGADVDESWYKHSSIHYKGETFENHQYFVHTREGKRSKLLQKELLEVLNTKKWEHFPNSSICLPPTQWNAMFLTYHACAHFITEGLRLKQVLDWAVFLQKEQDNVDWDEFYAFCDRHHLRRFAEAITTICVKYLGIQVSKSVLATDSPYAEKILHCMLYDDDYIYGTGETSWGGRWHLVKNLFKYRWKFEEIYQQSVWKQLWWYFTGFIFHTEGA